MRVVEPSNFKSIPEPRKSHPYKRSFLLFGVLLVAGVFFFRSGAVISPDKSVEQSVQTSSEDPETTQGDNLNPGDLRTFTGNEFKIFYENLLQPNLDEVDLPPVISGNDIADVRIREIAERRGYRLRSNPTVNLPSVDGYQLQEAVHQAWLELKQAAAADGIAISIVSAYRSVENQRQLFLGRLSAEGVDINNVEQGIADAEIDTVLMTSSIPGYSKHHTGYTMDFLCAGYSFDNFENSSCNDWLIADNYRSAKELGFIPSYPPDADLQGPAPEAWEYVWVGKDLLTKQ
jgi:hypothetical protein